MYNFQSLLWLTSARRRTITSMFTAIFEAGVESGGPMELLHRDTSPSRFGPLGRHQRHAKAISTYIQNNADNKISSSQSHHQPDVCTVATNRDKLVSYQPLGNPRGSSIGFNPVHPELIPCGPLVRPCAPLSRLITSG